MVVLEPHLGPTMRPSRRTLFPILLLIGSCFSGTGPGPGRPEDIAYILLIDQNGNDDTPHLPLYPGSPTTLQVRPYRADRTEITEIQGGASASFAFTPPTYASVRATADPLTLTVSAADTAGMPGSFMVKLTFPADTITKTFGPFYSLIH